MAIVNMIGLVVGGILLMQGIFYESYIKVALSILCLLTSGIGLISLLEKR